MPRPSTGLILAGGLAAALTLVVAWPVVLNPSQLIYGREIVGRHPDPYAVIAQIAGTVPSEASAQPLTDGVGRLLGRMMSPVAAFNVLVLATFPLTALAAYGLARYLTASHGAALVASLAFAFSPARLAHAAYHPHLVQTQWIPLFLLALVAAVDRFSVGRAAAVFLSCIALVLSSRDGALMAAVLSPVVLLAFWAIRPDASHNVRPALGPAAVLVVFGTAAIGLLWMLQPEILAAWPSRPVPVEDIALYRGRWWAYAAPPVDHPVLAGIGKAAAKRGGVNLQLVEEQLYLGFALVVLALVAIAVAGWRWFSAPRLRTAVALAAIGAAAALVSVGPTSGSCEPASLAPACLLVRIVPWFRAYARFGIVVQLAVAVAAGWGAMIMAGHSRTAKRLAMGMLVLAVFEYWPLPARAHDVLPTQGHRWLSKEGAGTRTLDCYPASRANATIPVLMHQKVTFLDGSLRTCQDPEFGRKLAALGYTHVLVRNGAAASKLPTPLPPGITVAETFVDSSVYAVSAALPQVITIAARGFYGYEHKNDDWWRWMGPAGQWTVRNTTNAPLPVTLSVDLVPIGVPRRLTVSLDNAPETTLNLGMTRSQHVFGPWTLTPGDHTLTFKADGEPTRPSDVNDASKDRRQLTVAFRNERWRDMPR